MNEDESLQKSENINNQKIIYDNIKQEIFSLINIKNKFNDVIKKNHIMNPKIFVKTEKTLFSKKNNNKKFALNIKKSKNKISIEKLEKEVHKKFFRLYNTNEDFYNVKIINEIISNDNSHIVAEFKDFLIKDDYSEFIQRFYNKEDSIFLLTQIFEYYKLSSVVYPNYILLPENKYIYRNIQKKQKIIDDQQEQEEKNNEEEKKKMNWTDRYRPLDKSEKVFDSRIIDSILNQSNTSQIQKFVFGVSHETSFDIEDNNNIFNLVKNINNAEEKSYIKFIEKNKQMNNNFNEEKNIINNQIKKNVNNIRQSNNINGNKIKTRNIHNYDELPNLEKNHDKFISNFGNFRNHNRGKNNIYSLYINKNNENQFLKTNNSNKNKINIKNNNCIDDKSINLTKENIKNNLTISKSKDMKRGKNNYNILDSLGSSQIRKFDNFFKSDLNSNNNNLINIDNNNNQKKSKIIHNKEKINKPSNSIKDLIQLDKLKLQRNNVEISKEHNNKNNNCKYIKKTIINELLSSAGSSGKETWINSKLTESQKELNHFINKTDRGRKSIKNISNKNINNQKTINNNRNVSEIIGENYKYINYSKREMNIGKSHKQISLDIDLINNKRKNNLININEQNLISSTIGNHYKKNSIIDLNLLNERNTIAACKNEGNLHFFENQFINSNINNTNFGEGIIEKDIKNENKNLNKIKEKSIKSRNRNISKKNDINIPNNQFNNNRRHIYSRNNRVSSNICEKNLTYAKINMKKYINNNSIQINNNINYKNNSNNNFGDIQDTITAIPTSLKEKLKLNFDFLKQNQTNPTENCYKKIEPQRGIFLTAKNSKNININKGIKKNKNKYNPYIKNNKKKQKDFYPLSDRDHNNSVYNRNNYNKNIINKNYKGVLKNKRKLKNSFNENKIDNLLFGYSKSYKTKNKYMKKIQNINGNNQNLILLNFINKNEEKNYSKTKKSTISEVNSKQKKRRKVSSYIYPNSNINNTEVNPGLVNFNSSLNNYSNSNNKSNKSRNIDINLNDIKTTINFNYDEKSKNDELMNSPNLENRLSTKFKHNSNTKNLSNDDFIRPNNAINNKNTRYYNIEVNINNELNNSKLYDSKDKIPINNVNKDYNKQHFKLNSTTQFSTGSLNINFNNYTNNYCFNYNNNSIMATNQNKLKFTQIEPKNYKREKKNMKNNIKGFQINGFGKIILNKNDKNNNSFFPLALTDRTEQEHIFSPINSYSISIAKKNKK